ncbi:NAD(P)H-dependent oxidoreductase [Streptomyces racemochromogenes]|uniref:NAD(P)H-dependent oxidoreductase n=1 Tax=Streptomyces racemochromogenes TaxID=67353 RepID=A0ABW7PH13_9ACTN
MSVAETTTAAPLRVAVIIGSVRENRRGPAVTEWFLRAAEGYTGLEFDVIDLADVTLPLTLPDWGSSPDAETAAVLERVTPRLADADAYVVVTPEYNHSYPASVKNLVDWHRPQWQAKPVGFVSYGGVSGGLRAVEQLRLVFAEMHAVTVRDSVSLHGPWNGLGPDGEPRETVVVDSAVKNLLGQLDWWGRALRTARTVHPYEA